MQRAVDEGPQSVEALRDLLHFSGSPFNNQTFGTTADGRMQARLLLLEKLDKSWTGSHLESQQSNCHDVGRVNDKHKLAKKLSAKKFDKPLVDKLPDPLGRTVKAQEQTQERGRS